MPMIPFERTTAQVITLDTTAYTFATLAVNANVARVPRSLVIYKPAGTAFTVGAGARLEVQDDDNNVLFSVSAVGFLDQATAQSRYVEAATSGKAFTAGSTTFDLSATAGLSGGGSTVYFRLEYDEVPIVL